MKLRSPDHLFGSGEEIFFFFFFFFFCSFNAFYSPFFYMLTSKVPWGARVAKPPIRGMI